MTPTAVRCPLCNLALAPQDQAAACARCPFRPSDCHAICCPRCGYSWVASSPLVRRIARWWSARRRRGERPPVAPAAPAVVSLAQLALGEEGVVASLQSRRPAYLQRLGAVGVLPGRRLRLRQRQPALIIQVGETELALDAHAGGEIFVRRVLWMTGS
ncbi:MAG: ferrous iron transport protein A [Candidatus Omnitrophica bacterium]|nr:ferrous iron transport protein A [Candidatus Omnitrophota bacterium]